MSNLLKTVALGALLGLSLTIAPTTFAEDTAAPAGMPDEISALFDDAELQGGEVTFAPAEETPTDGALDGDQSTAAGNRYLYTTLRVIANGGNRGCNSGDWNCMTRLCKRDLRSNSAWRGWAGCWKKGSKFICYFECGQRRAAF